MGHFVFIILHIIAIFFSALLLLITIPLHLIYAALSSKKSPSIVVDPNAPTPETHVRCPQCKELVRADAVKCKHCGTGLVPVDMTDMVVARKAREDAARLGTMIRIGVIALVLIAAYYTSQYLAGR